MSPEAVTLRPALTSDELFLLELRKLTMTEHLERVGEPTDDETHYRRIRARYGDANIICQGAARIGLLKVRRDADEWVLVQFQVLPSYQGQGIGKRVVRALLEQARQAQRPVRLSVLKGNPARRLYERLGFQPTSETDHDSALIWRPELSGTRCCGSCDPAPNE